jgi:type I restriction enzyme M protein
MGGIFNRVKARYRSIFDINDQIRLQARSLAYVVGELQRYSLLDTNIDVKGKAYEELVGANLRGDRGEFFTPRNVAHMAIDMVSIRPNEKILDPACGTGGFLVIAMNKIVDALRRGASSEISSDSMRAALQDRIREIASQSFFGIDINPDLVKATKMNMVMNNDGSGNIFRQDSLLHPHEWDSEFREQFASSLQVDPRTLRRPQDLGLFDIVATNPPFGSKLPIKDRQTLAQYELGHVWVKSEGQWKQSDKLQTSQPPEILFIERCWQFLRPGGRMVIVLPDAILGAPGLAYVRAWMLRYCRLVASVDLHPDTFQPRNGTQTSVLLLQRKTDAELMRDARQGRISDYEIFMAQVNAIGHDKRGNTVFKRNEEGAEILVPFDQSKAALLERAADGSASVRPLPRERVIDDDTPEIAAEFSEWKTKAVLGW